MLEDPVDRDDDLPPFFVQKEKSRKDKQWSTKHYIKPKIEPEPN